MVRSNVSIALIVRSSARFHQASLLPVYKNAVLGIATPLDLNSGSVTELPDPCLVRASSRLLRSITLLVGTPHHTLTTPTTHPPFSAIYIRSVPSMSL